MQCFKITPIVGADPCVRPPPKTSVNAFIYVMTEICVGGRTHGSAPTIGGNTMRKYRLTICMC